MISFDLAQYPQLVEITMKVIMEATDLGVSWKRRNLPSATLYAAEEIRAGALARGWSLTQADMVAAFVLQVGAEEMAETVRAGVYTVEQVKAATPGLGS